MCVREVKRWGTAEKEGLDRVVLHGAAAIEASTGQPEVTRRLVLVPQVGGPGWATRYISSASAIVRRKRIKW